MVFFGQIPQCAHHWKTTTGTQWEEDFLSQLRGEDPEEPEAEEPEEEQQEATTRPTLTSQQASDYLSQLQDFAMQQKNPELLELITKSLSCMDEIRCQQTKNFKQTNLPSFLNKL